MRRSLTMVLLVLAWAVMAIGCAKQIPLNQANAEIWEIVYKSPALTIKSNMKVYRKIVGKKTYKIVSEGDGVFKAGGFAGTLTINISGMIANGVMKSRMNGDYDPGTGSGYYTGQLTGTMSASEGSGDFSIISGSRLGILGGKWKAVKVRQADAFPAAPSMDSGTQSSTPSL